MVSNFFRLDFWTAIDYRDIFFLLFHGLILLHALLMAHILISDFRFDYCGSIPLATALGINIRVIGAEAVRIPLKLILDI